jgi:hypothetical protein
VKVAGLQPGLQLSGMRSGIVATYQRHQYEDERLAMSKTLWERIAGLASSQAPAL